MSENRIPENKMGVMPVGKLLLNMALPMIISMLVQALYNVVDSIYISRVSENAVTALSLAFPIQNLQIGAAVGIGVGVNALLSKSLGEKNHEMTNFAAGNGLLLAAICTVIFMIFGVVGVRPYYMMQNTSIETAEAGIAYTSICCLLTGGIFLEILFERLLQATGRTFHTMITQGVGAIANIVLDPVFIFGVEALGIFMEILGERLLQATGRTVHTMITQSTGAIINIILDPILIHGWFGVPAMGVAGAAVATVIGQWIGALVGFYFNAKHNPDVQFGGRYLKLEKKTIGAILTVGIPSVVMNSIGSVMNFGMNQILQGFAETATSVFGIYFKLQSFFFMPLFGLNNATISIIAFNYGARKPQRITKTLKLSVCGALGLMTAGWAAFQFAPDLLLGMFNPSPAFLEMGRSCLRTISWSFPLAAVCISLGASFQALGNGIYSTITSVCRQLVVLLPVAYLMSLSGDVHSVWLAYPIAEVASGTVTAFFFARIYRQKIKPLF